MGATRKYLYQDWLLGKVCLKYDVLIQNHAKKPVLVTWDNFNQHEISKIKNRQKLIFEQRVKKQVDYFKKVFIDSYKGSQAKEIFILKEKEQVAEILEGQIPNEKFISTQYWNVVFFNEYIKGIQSYYNNVIIRNLPFDYSFIHSDKVGYRNIDEMPASIYCQALWEYLKWIESQYCSTHSGSSVIDTHHRKYTAKEYALAYVLDAYASGIQVPQNKTAGGNSKKEIKLIGEAKGIKGDTFYRAVLCIGKYDLNKKFDLLQISKDWEHVVKDLCSDWPKIQNYLRGKLLIGE